MDDPTAAAAPAPSLILVDDDEAVREALERVLRMNGYPVESFAGARAALDRLARSAETAAGVLTDIVMPGMRGTELAREVRARWPGLPVIFLSGHADERVLQEFAPFGPAYGIGYLLKPYALDQLFALLREHGITPSELRVGGG
jgi:two-component system cell cycle sensor histidine kinase/response regulator CckA